MAYYLVTEKDMKKPKHIKPKHLMERIMAVLLSVSMVLTILNLTAFAMPFDEDTIRIVGFGELSNEVKEQTLKEGALESDIAFPESLLVTVEKYKLLEKLDSKELTETKEKKTKEDKSKEKTKEEKKTKDKKTDADEEDPLAEDKEGVKDPDKKTKTETDKELSEDEEAAEDEKEATEEDEKINEQKDASTQESSSETEQGSKDESVQDSSDTDTPASESSENAATEESPEAEPASEDNAGDDQGNDAVEESETSGGEEAPEETNTSSDAGNDSARAGFSFSDFFKARTVFAAEQDDQLEVSEDQPEEDSSEVSEEVGDEDSESESEQEAVQEEAEEESGDETALEEAKDEESDESTLEESEDEEDDEKALKKSEDEAGDKKALEKSEDEEEPEYETEVEDVVLEGVTWELDKKNSSFAKFTSDEPGAKFVYIPVVPEGFKIACDYPTITVTIEEPLEKEIRSAPFSQSCVVDGVYITVFADEGVFPVDARLTAERASDQTRASAEEAVEEQRGEDCNVVASYVFDIKIVDEDWREIQPDTSKGSVKVAFSLDGVSNDNLDVEIYHIVEDGGTCAQRLDASEEGDTVVAETEGFSAYTLQVTYDVKLYDFTTLPVKLSQILNKVVLSGTPVSAPIPSDASLIMVTPDQNGDYDIDVTGTFSSVESLNVELSDGNVYEILLTQGYKQAGGGSLIYETGFNQPATDLVDVILGKGIVATNQQKNGTVYTFGNGDVDIGLPSGILLDTSGKIPNTTQDPDLAALCSSLGVQYGGDTSVLEFEMQATGTELVFNYAFGSAEFNQSPSFNDVFGLFISINGGPYQNIALITRSDGTQVPVTIVNLRAGIDGTEMNNGKSTTLGPSVTHTLFTEKALTLIGTTNGISNVFTASQLVNIGDTIKLKFAICDVGDTGVNSFVFIEAGSLQFNAPDGKNDYYGEEIHNLDPGAEFEITCGGDTHPVTSSSAGRIPMEGTDDNGDSYSFLGETITIVKKGDGVHQDSPPQTLTVADRPEVVDLDTSQGAREISTTDTSIILTLDPSDPDRMRQEYRLFDGNGNPISGYDWVNAGDQGGNLHFDGLDPDTEYIVKIYVPATDDYPKSLITAGVRIKTDPEPLPPPVKRTEVVVHGGGSPVSQASVKDLDDYTQEQTGQKVIVRLNIIPEDETAVDPATVSYVDANLKTQYPLSSNDHIFAEYMDMNVTRQIDDGPIEDISDVERVVEIAVGYDLTGKLDPVVYRERDGNITVLDKLTSRPSGNYQDGKVYISGNTIYIYEQYFSDTYAVGYYTYEDPVKTTEVVVHGGAGPISNASADKLDDYTQEQDGQRVLVRLNITPEDESSVAPSTVSFVDTELKTLYTTASADHIFAEYMDMNVTRQINNGPVEYIPDVERVIEIAVGYDLTDKLDPVVFREQGGTVTVLDKLQSRPAGNYQAGKVYIDGNTIYIYEQYFSDTYAVGYHTYEEPDPPPPPVKKTEVVVHGGGSTISSASADKLDDYTQEQDGQKVLVRLNITPEDDATVNPATVTYVEDDIKKRYKNYSDDHIFAEYMEMNVTRQINDGPIEYIPDVERVIEIAVNYDLTDKLDPVVFREQGGDTTILDKLPSRPAGNYQAGKVYIDGNTIYIYEQNFSDTYAVGYHTYEAPDKKTEVVVNGGTGTISQASANKLDDYTQEQDGQKVLVRLNITPEDESSVKPASVAYVDADLKSRY